MGEVTLQNYPGRGCWCAVVPLICIEVVEWHQPDRVMRQFGMQQFIPRPPFQDLRLHRVVKNSNREGDWRTYFRVFIQTWNDRINQTVASGPCDVTQPLGFQSDYLVWYRAITRRWMTVLGSVRVLEVTY